MQDALSQRVRGWTPFFVLTDVLFLFAAFMAASLMSYLIPPNLDQFTLVPAAKECVVLWVSMAAVIFHAAVWLREGYYMHKLLNGEIYKISLSQSGFTALLLLFYVALWRDVEISRKLIVYHLAFSAPFLCAAKIVFIKVLKALGSRIQPRLRVVAACEPPSVESMRSWFANKRMLGIKLCDVICPEHKIEDIRSLERRLEEAIVRERPNLVIWRMPTNALRTERVREMAESHGAHLAVDLQPILGELTPTHVFEYSTMKLVSLHKHPLVNPSHRFLKRVLDVAVSLPVVLFVLPLLCAGVWMLHRLFSPGPLFFKQSRSGADGQMFQILKFRTMAVNHGSESVQARPNDKRVFKGGALLRKLSIDEMPQFLNVFLGDMSVVGPRPHMVEHDAIFAMECSQYPLRHTVKPGVTGLAQVRGHRGPIDGAEEIKHRVTSDIEYCQNWSFLLDVAIIARTFLHVFSFHAKSC
ncbi:MAG: exopolysaccharide biosynthesis polyprenyl glycosylphosphotransferase [Prosthecobacter sp.]|jgi:exopolysaccharide biosynthesis polyprenyl glycosylphosphotransferase|uniref:exopolysaccharide biosynthesis polyprenyl glycosylphosphotransferase n=1 Tax=Prosthecobacter sp. TaxID=1965333 RepID=UPI0019EA4746|nr:exopolysaccharide biosynthesis polyprenyl glycosylphosphotransferase [Prosthecobacter sp.]MBE2286306.1 exopolysaccharide biosynthesis polyprenyl glycosylphosphotransferase [Prosthecobacter sp.]